MPNGPRASAGLDADHARWLLTSMRRIHPIRSQVLQKLWLRMK